MSLPATKAQIEREDALLGKVYEVTQIIMSPACEGTLRHAFRRVLASSEPGSKLDDSWSIAFEERGAHVHVTVRHGTPGSRALLGSMMMTPEEARDFGRALGVSSTPG